MAARSCCGPGQRVPARLPYPLPQPVLGGAEESLHTPLGLRRVRRDPFDPQLLQRPADLRLGKLALELFVPLLRPAGLKQAPFIGVERQRPPPPPHITT